MVREQYWGDPYHPNMQRDDTGEMFPSIRNQESKENVGYIYYIYIFTSRVAKSGVEACNFCIRSEF